MPTSRRVFWETNEGFCDRCDAPGFLLDGICSRGQCDPKLTREPVTGRAVLSQCLVCGHDSDNELCPRCHKEASEQLDDWTRKAGW